jgi:hypothetical protein
LWRAGIVFKPNLPDDIERHRHPQRDSNRLARRIAVCLREQGVQAVPMVTDWTSVDGSPEVKEDVVRIVLKHIPAPSEEHSLDDILAFKEEARARGLTRDLRLWMSETASGKLSPPDIAAKVAQLADRYKRS